MQVTGAGLKEAHVHDVDIIKEAPQLQGGIVRRLKAQGKR